MRGPWLALAILLLSAPPSRAKLEIRDIQACDGPLGPVRESLDYYPHDEANFRFNIVGIQVDAEGKADGELTFSLKNDEGTVLLNEPSDLAGLVALGGAAVPGTARVTLAGGVAPGRYTLTVTVRDRRSSETASFRRTLRVKPAEFAIVAPRFFFDADGKVPAPAGGVVGQTLYIRLGAIGFDRAGGKIDTEMALLLLDEKGRPLLPKPLRKELVSDDADLVKQANVVNFNAFLALNRAGSFRLRVDVTDRIAGKTARFETALRVANP
jgi:hypothetical protein